MSERAFRNTVDQRRSFTLVSSTSHIYRMGVSIEFRMVISQNQSRQVSYHNVLTEIFINIQITRQGSLSIRQFRASPHTHPSPRLRSRRPYRRHPCWHRDFFMHHQYREEIHPFSDFRRRFLRIAQVLSGWYPPRMESMVSPGYAMGRWPNFRWRLVPRCRRDSLDRQRNLRRGGEGENQRMLSFLGE